MSDLTWEHEKEARAALNRMMSDPARGFEVLTNAQMMSNLLKDYRPAVPWEKQILVAAAEAGLALALRGHVLRRMDPDIAIRSTASSFSASTNFTPEASTWIAEELAIALCLHPAINHVSIASPGKAVGQDRPYASVIRASLNMIMTSPEYGFAILADPRRLPQILNRYLPSDAAKQKQLLLSAAEAGVALTLQDSVPQGLDLHATIRSAASSFSTGSTFTPEECTWVAEEFAIALRVHPAIAYLNGSWPGSAASVPAKVLFPRESASPEVPVTAPALLPGHVFISYIRPDAQFVDSLQDRLQSAGIKVWRDTKDLWPGQDWRQEIRRAISDESLVFIACFSRNSVSRAKSFQNDEIVLAIEQLRSRSPDVPWLIPVRFDDCDIPDRDIGGGRTLRSIQRADLFGDQHADEVERLVVAVKRMLSSGPGASPPEGKDSSPWPERVLDSDDIESLNPRDVARRLAAMRPDDAVRAIAGATVAAAAEVFEVLLEDNEALAVSLLAHGRRRKARDLIAAIESAEEWLKKLPEAADAIDRCERSHRAVLDENSGSLTHLGPSRVGSHGYRRNYAKGVVSWTSRSGAHTITGEVWDCYTEADSSGIGSLGFALTSEIDAEPSPFGTTGRCQRFESSILPDRTGKITGPTIYRSDRHGTYPTLGRISEYYEGRGGTAGQLGFPVSTQASVGPSARGTASTCQRFEGGSLYLSNHAGVIEVRAPIRIHLEHLHGGVTSELGFPVGPEYKAGSSPYQTIGYFQRFEGQSDYPADIQNRSNDLGGFGAIVYVSQKHGVWCVSGRIGVLYEELGGAESWLGFPKSDEIRTTYSNESWRIIQVFEGGAILCTTEHGSVTVPRATMDVLSPNTLLSTRLGTPLARPPETPPDAEVQYFEHGVVTNHDGVVEAWFRHDL